MRAPDHIRLALRQAGIQLTDLQWDQLARYAADLLEANAVVNLISRKDQENLWESHLVHSLALLAVLQFPTGARILDLGTGGGLPGIPLAICRPDLSIDLLDSIQKKTRAVQSFVDRLSLPSVHVLTGRGEEMKASPGYQIVIARAVAPLVHLLKWTAKLYDRNQRQSVRVIHGTAEETVQTPMLVAMKGGELDEEIEKAKVRYPTIVPIVARIPGVVPGSTALDDKKIIIIAR